jgi:exodeoxyribonuclease III
VTRTELPGDPNDRQSRYIEAAVKGVIIASLYAPAEIQLQACLARGFARHALELYRAGAPVVLAGDYNVVPTPQDIYPTTLTRRTLSSR